jgi:alpha-ketoglutarate-dependent taurine dioxygenase
MNVASGVRTHSTEIVGGPKAWSAAQLDEDAHWTLRVGDSEHRDAEALARWAANHAAPEERYVSGIIETPALAALGEAIRFRLKHLHGIVRITGFDPKLDDATLRMAYLATGLGTGDALTQYGRLFDVKDRGEDYRTSAVPVSMTRESTSFHTDSSARDVQPDYVGLLCLQAALQGGESLVSSAMAAHDALRVLAPESLALLYDDYFRDVVTPGTGRNLNSIRENKFPIYRYDPAVRRMTFRYMRYWIERAHSLLQQPLSEETIGAFDQLDALLCDPRFMISFTLQRGEMLWVDNRSMAHNRSAFVDDPDAPRTMVRMWTVDNVVNA